MPIKPEMALPGWREYQTAPATKTRVAATPMKSPFFEPVAGPSVGCEASPRSWPPKTAASGRRVASCPSDKPSSGNVSGLRETASLKEELADAAGIAEADAESFSRASGASQAGILISSSAIEAEVGLGEGAATLMGLKGSGAGLAIAGTF